MLTSDDGTTIPCGRINEAEIKEEDERIRRIVSLLVGLIHRGLGSLIIDYLDGTKG